MAAPRILVVDDDPQILSICARALSPKGFEVVVASNARAAKMRLQTTKIDLVVADARLPTESGISLLYEIKETVPDLPVILITGYPDLSAVDAALKLHVDDFVTKPFSLPDLVSRVEQILRKRSANTVSPLQDLAPEMIEELKHKGFPILEGIVQRDSTNGQISIVPIAATTHLANLTTGDRVWMILTSREQLDNAQTTPDRHTEAE